MEQSVSPLYKKEPNGIQETNIRPIKAVILVVVIQIDLTPGLQTLSHSFTYQHTEESEGEESKAFSP